MQQCVALGDVVDIGSSADDGMYQARVSIHADMRLHSKVPLVALLDLMHLRVTLAVFVLGGARRCNQGGINDCAAPKQQAMCGQFGVDDLKDLRAQLVFFEKMPEPQDADPVSNALGAADAHEVAIKAGLEQGFFSAQIGQTKPLLQTVDTQHHCNVKRWASRLGHRCARRYQRQQLSPRHDLLHLIEQDFFACAPRTEIKAKVCLFHANNDRKFCASVTTVAKEF
jgi:hypothetical protein